MYKFSNGLRHVVPYYHKYVANARLRWWGRTCLDVYSEEFKNQPPEHYRQLILDGKMTLVKNPNSKLHSQEFSGEQLLSAVKVGRGDKIVHYEHVHEPPVLATEPDVVFEDEQYVVVDKPAGVPVHPVGSYFHNSVTEIVYHSRPELRPLFPVHRLDKLTSGVLIFGKTQEATAQFKGLMKEHQVDKTYLAEVDGNFTGEVCDDSIVYIYGSRREVKQFGPARTTFTKLSFNGHRSVVECHPVTGFSHQIRIHLRNMGFPIVNDALYRDKYTRVFTDRTQMTPEYLDEVYKLSMEKRTSMEAERCPECHTRLYKDPRVDDLAIHLHSLRYKIGSYTFETQLPKWARGT